MRLKRYFHTMGSSEACRLAPVGNEALFPLPLQSCGVLRRPGGGDPVRCAVRGRASGATGEGDDYRHLECFGEPNRVTEDSVIAFCNRCLRMHRIAMAREGADREPCIRKSGAVVAKSIAIAKKSGGFDMTAAGPAACADLQHADRRIACHFLQQLMERQLVEDGREQTKPHR